MSGKEGTKKKGGAPVTMARARPSAMAVLPTPGSPSSTGLFLVRRPSTCTTRATSASRPITCTQADTAVCNLAHPTYLMT